MNFNFSTAKQETFLLPKSWSESNIYQETYSSINYLKVFSHCCDHAIKYIFFFYQKIYLFPMLACTYARLIFTLQVPILFLGGTLGLFTGMSILSMIEIGFWICRLIVAGLSDVKPCKKPMKK